MMIESNNKQTHILYGELKFKYILKIVIKRNFLCQKKKKKKNLLSYLAISTSCCYENDAEVEFLLIIWIVNMTPLVVNLNLLRLSQYCCTYPETKTNSRNYQTQSPYIYTSIIFCFYTTIFLLVYLFVH